MQNNKEQYLSIGEASEYLGVSIDTLRRWTKKGKLTAFLSPGNHRYFTKSHLDSVFGTRYERKETDKPKKEVKVDQETPQASQVDTSQRLKSDPEPTIAHLDDPSIYLAHETDFVTPVENKKTEEIAVPVEKEPLNVPRFIRRQSISKYDYLLQSREYANHKEIIAPETAGKISEHIAQPVSPVSFEIKNIKSILTPPQMQIPETKARVVVVEEKEEAQKNKVTVKQRGNLDTVLIRIFFGFLILDVVLFVFWFVTQKINSPLP